MILVSTTTRAPVSPIVYYIVRMPKFAEHSVWCLLDAMHFLHISAVIPIECREAIVDRAHTGTHGSGQNRQVNERALLRGFSVTPVKLKSKLFVSAYCASWRAFNSVTLS